MVDTLVGPDPLIERLVSGLGGPELPVPEWALAPGQQLIAGLLFASLSLVALIYSVRIALRIREPYPIYVMLASGLIVFGEPFVDVLGHFAFPEIGVMPYLHALGRTVPMYFAPAYLFYFGTFWLVTMRIIAGGVTSTGWWRWYGGAAAFALVVEPPFMHFGWWIYYGPNQPLTFFGLPVWWAVANPASALVAGAILQVVIERRILTGWRTVAIFPLLPAVFIGADTMMALPVYLALNSTNSVVVTNIAQLVTIGLALAAVWICGRLVVDRGAAPEHVEPVPTLADQTVRPSA